ncbi:hypothetical protein B0T14DRAFT_604990 [Immersiella caudata]|uniref:Lectin n=1 Tax=Immersiella caudata TaxID=314043 RepID=A0AA39WJZ9_9PEZI|nr:hypothetical protein B0T14DRAFT_604990 [Immersiella caudata]
MLSQLAAVVLGLAAVVAAAPAQEVTSSLSPRAFNCNNPVTGLNKGDCEYLSRIGFAGMGSNPTNSDSRIWIGNNGPNIFTFTNRASVDIVLVLWDSSNGYASSFVTAHAPKLTYSIPRGSSINVSLANGVTGAYSAIYDRTTVISPNGQVFNTWGEFTTGNHATIDISRLINMGGNSFSARVSTGCVADNSRCAYICKWGKNTCWESGTYDLIGCIDQKNNNAWYGANPEGGCAGWDSGSGRISAEFY